MPHHVVNLVTEALNDHSKCIRGSRILVLGVAYKPNVGDFREVSGPGDPGDAGASRRADILLRSVRSEPGARQLAVAEPGADGGAAAGCDCALVVTHHRDFDFEMVVREAPLVIDTRNATRPFAHLGKVRFL